VTVKKLRIDELRPSDSRLMPETLGEGRVTGGGVHCFAPGETAHPEPRHVHDVHEVFIFVQGRGVLPVDGVEHPIETGDVFVIEPGEDHHTRSSEDDPLVAAWYLMEA
jgi:mannose-6-phosphate isomerase-like protein (cupin superfamily)